MVCMLHKQPISAWASGTATFHMLRSHRWLVASGYCIKQHRFCSKCSGNAVLHNLQSSPSRMDSSLDLCPPVCMVLTFRVLCSGPTEGVLTRVRVLKADLRAPQGNSRDPEPVEVVRPGTPKEREPFCAGTRKACRFVQFPGSTVVYVPVALLQLQYQQGTALAICAPLGHDLISFQDRIHLHIRPQRDTKRSLWRALPFWWWYKWRYLTVILALQNRISELPMSPTFKVGCSSLTSTRLPGRETMMRQGRLRTSGHLHT